MKLQLHAIRYKSGRIDGLLKGDDGNAKFGWVRMRPTVKKTAWSSANSSHQSELRQQGAVFQKKKKKVIWKTGSTNVQRNLDGHEITFYDIEFLFKELSNNLIEKIETLTMTVLPWRLLLLCRIMKTKCSKISFPFWLRATWIGQQNEPDSNPDSTAKLPRWASSPEKNRKHLKDFVPVAVTSTKFI